jgi:hypothetical protein
VVSESLAAVTGAAPGILRAAGLGPRCPVASVTRLAGGSKKGVYRLSCAGGFSAVLYAWSAGEDYWAASASSAASSAEGDGVFGHASGLGLFSASARRLTEAGVRVPRVYLADGSHALYPADIALVEDVRGGTLEELLSVDSLAARPVLDRLGDMLRSMWERRAARPGKVVAVAEPGDGAATPAEASGAGAAGGPSSEEIVVERALRQLAGAAERVPAIAEARPRLESTLLALAASVRPRASYALIHGELGPDHVSIDDRGQPVLVDIEGAMYFDVEWEHAFLRLRFGRHYERLQVAGLDEDRMSLYALALDLSLIEGPLRLLDGDFPDREEMLAIVGWAVERALRTANADR